jgi:hypothetical protein
MRIGLSDNLRKDMQHAIEQSRPKERTEPGILTGLFHVPYLDGGRTSGP